MTAFFHFLCVTFTNVLASYLNVKFDQHCVVTVDFKRTYKSNELCGLFAEVRGKFVVLFQRN